MLDDLSELLLGIQSSQIINRPLQGFHSVQRTCGQTSQIFQTQNTLSHQGSRKLAPKVPCIVFSTARSRPSVIHQGLPHRAVNLSKKLASVFPPDFAPLLVCTFLTAQSRQDQTGSLHSMPISFVCQDAMSHPLEFSHHQ